MGVKGNEGAGGGGGGQGGKVTYFCHSVPKSRRLIIRCIFFLEKKIQEKRKKRKTEKNWSKSHTAAAEPLHKENV